MKKYKKDNWFQLSALIPKPASEAEEEGWKNEKAGSEKGDIPTPAHSPKGEWRHSAENQRKERYAD